MKKKPRVTSDQKLDSYHIKLIAVVFNAKTEFDLT